MAVVIETTLGDITVDLYLEQRPVTCLNFLKLCKMKYYNYNLFHTIRSGFIAQTGDPTGEGPNGESIWGILEGPQKRFFSGEKRPKIRHTDAGLLSMVCTDDMMVGSQFFFTLAPDLDSLDGTHCVIGEVSEGHDVLSKFNEVICDESHRPYRDVRITHTVVLSDPFNDPSGLAAPSRSPSPSAERLKGGRIAPDEEIDETQGKTAEELQELIEDKEAKARATILEIVGDLPDADIAPPENVLFVCKLNPVTSDDDLEIIFSRFGKIVCCEVIRDKKTDNSLQYAFIEFADKKSCEEAYFKMDNVLIDDRRIHVDFSQSVSKMRWLGKGRGVKFLDDNNSEETSHNDNNLKRRSSKERDRNIDKNEYFNSDTRRHDHKEHKNKRIQSYYNHEQKSNRDQNETQTKERSRRNRSRSHSRLETSQNKPYRRDFEHKREIDKSYKNGRNDSSYKNRNKYDKSPARKHKRDNNELPPTNKRQRTYDKEYYNKSKINKEYHSDLNRQEKEESKKLNVKGKHHDEPKTPSPILDRTNLKFKKDKLKSKQKQNKKDRSIKRKKSSSTSSDSSSSSTSESSSSSESDRKRKKVIKKKRKYSTSSSSSSSTTSSSSSSSSSDSSSSDSDVSKKRRKKKLTKKSQKSKK